MRIKFVSENEGKRPLGKRRRRLEDNTKMDLRETEWNRVRGILTGFVWLGIGTNGGLL
jgi:hypothetical protein